MVEKEIVVGGPAADVFDARLDPAKVVRWISAHATEIPTMVSEPEVGGAYHRESDDGLVVGYLRMGGVNWSFATEENKELFLADPPNMRLNSAVTAPRRSLPA